jgi:hypothetical protein
MRRRTGRDGRRSRPRGAPVDEGIARPLLPAAMRGELPMAALAPAFTRAFWLRWLAGVVTARPSLERFATLTHEERVAEFRRLDERVFMENRAALVGQLRERVQHQLREGDGRGGDGGAAARDRAPARPRAAAAHADAGRRRGARHQALLDDVAADGRAVPERRRARASTS